MTRHNKQPPREYAIERANATGKPYVISNMGHVMWAVPENLASMDELGGVLEIVYPQRKPRKNRGKEMRRGF